MLLTSNHSALAEQHLDRLAFGWQKRARMVESHVVDFAELTRLDGTLGASAQALAEFGPAVAEMLCSRFDEAILAPEGFALTLCAITRKDEALGRACWGLLQSLPQQRAAFCAALEWAASTDVINAAKQWKPTDPAFDGVLGVVGLAHPSLRPEIKMDWPTQPSATDDWNVALMRYAAVHSGEAAYPLAYELLYSPSSINQCAAADYFLGQPRNRYQQAAVERLAKIAGTPGPTQREAVFLLAIHSANTLESLLNDLAQEPRIHIQALGWLGSRAYVKTLLTYMVNEKLARLAGAALSMLTGSLPAKDSWEKPPENTPERQIDLSADIPPPRLDADLPAPEQSAATAWWTHNQQQFETNERYLGGLSETIPNLLTVLRSGKLAWRRVAAHRLHKLGHGQRIITSLPAFTQRLQMARLAQGV